MGWDRIPEMGRKTGHVTEAAVGADFDGITKARELLKAASLASREQLEKEGGFRSCYASLMTAPDRMLTEVRSNLYIVFQLDEPVDAKLLQQATDLAVRKCPYVLYDIRLCAGIPWVRFQRNPLQLPVQKAGTPKCYGTEENNGHFVTVGYEGDRIHFGMSHVMSDGVGFHFFVYAVLRAYYGIRDEILFETEKAGQDEFLTDFASVEYPLPEGYTPYDNAAAEHFEIPKQTDGGHGFFSGKIVLPTGTLHGFAKDWGLSRQEALCALTAEGIRRTYPDNEKTIRIRCPINSRRTFGIHHTFQNASMPHLFVNIDPGKLSGDGFAETAAGLKEQFSAQLNYANIAHITNRFSRFFRSGELRDLQDVFGWYMGQTGVLASYIGKGADERVSRHILDLDQSIEPSFPLMVYATETGENIFVQVLLQADRETRVFDGLQEVFTALSRSSC